MSATPDIYVMVAETGRQRPVLRSRPRCVDQISFQGLREERIMGFFRYENRYAAPTRKQRERYMRGEVKEHHFGPDGEITLLLYPEAAYLKDDIDGVRILFTGISEKPRAVEETKRMVEYHERRDDRRNSFRTGDDT